MSPEESSIKTMKQIHQALKLLVTSLALGFIIQAINVFFFTYDDGEQLLALGMLTTILLVCLILSTGPNDIHSAPLPELTPDSLERSKNKHVYRFRNRFMRSSRLGHHVVAYVGIDLDTKHIDFLNCGFGTGIKSPDAFPLDKKSYFCEATIDLRSSYTNQTGCEISRLVDAAMTDFGGYYLIYWPVHLAVVASRMTGFPKFEATLKACGFDIKTRVYVPPDDNPAVQNLRIIAVNIVLFASFIDGALVAPMHGHIWLYYLYVILICGSMTSATCHLFTGGKSMSFTSVQSGVIKREWRN